MTLAAGSIAFTGFNADGNDSLAFVALENLVSGTIIYFGDNEWNGLAIGAGGAFNTGEGAIALTLTANVAAGTIVTLNDLSVATRNSNFGTVTGSVALGNSNETVYAYLGSSATTPTTFLAAITNSTFTVADGQLAGTGLTAGTDAIALSPPGSPDVAVFTGARTGLASFAAYRSSINNAANWITQDGSGDQSFDNIAPDVPFSAAAFTVAGGNASISINDLAITEGNSGTSLLTFTVTRTDNSGAFSVDFASSDGTAQAPGDYVAAAGTINFTAGGALTQSISVTINGDTTNEANETLTVTLSNIVNTTGTATLGDASGVGTISNDDVGVTPINAIQGAAHISPLLGLTVTTTGIVTAVDSNGFYLQTRDADIDASIATSEAIFVFTSSAPAVAVGDAVNVTGTVGEFTPGGASTGNLSTTQLSSPTTTVLSSGNALPGAILLGVGGRVLPTENIDNDGLASFDPTSDGVDFYESLEAMRVTVPSPRAVSATNSFGEIYTVANNGAGATGLSTRGTIVTQGSVGNGLNFTNTGAGSDYNPERIQIDADSNITPGGTPLVDVGAVLNDITGVIGYNFGNFEVIPTTAITVSTPSILTAETTSLNGAGSVLTIASYNVLNLDPNEADGDTDIADGRFVSIANQIVFNLNTPDIIALQEVQDNSGSANDGTVSASLTLQTLVNAISTAGGPVYNFVDNSFITNNTNGGEPGGNIRVAYLYDASRVTLASTSTTPNAAIDFAGSRPPLVANFSFGSETITVIDNHFTSKGGSSPLYGVNQPSLNGGAAERLTQATNVANFVTSLGASAKVVVLGDLNEFTNEESLAPLSAAGLTPMSLTLVATERYSYIFDGNAQELDQVYLSGNLTSTATFDIVHTNTEFASTAASASDHDPSVLALNFTPGAQSLGFATGSLSFAQAEGNSGTTVYSFIIERTGGTDGALTFNGSIGAGSTDASDFGGILPTSFSGSIAAGASAATVTVTVSSDDRVEANENFNLTLTTASNSNSAPVSILGSAATATATIRNDDLIDLSNYVRVGRFDLPEPTRTTLPAGNLLAQEVSGVTYNWDTDTLFVVGDGGTSVVQVSKTGVLINSMTLAAGSSPQATAFYDPEGIAYIGNGQFVFTEERDRNLVKFTYVAGSTLDRSGAQIANLGTFSPNLGLEGVSYDPLTGGYILAKEKDPIGVFQTTVDFATNTASNGSASTVNSAPLFNPALLNVIDLADVYALSNVAAFNGTSQSDRLFVLSHESAEIIEVDRSGNIYSTRTIITDPGNPLDVVAQQHEGVAVGADGTLYVVSENGGGDFDHPQLWVYKQSLVPNAAPTAVALGSATPAILENTSTGARIKVADIVITDDGLGNNNLTLSGADAASFEADSTGLYIKAGVILDYETKTSYAVTVNVDDPAVGGAPDASVNYALNVTNVVNESALPKVYISEVAPWSSGNSSVGADWFEVTNGGNAALDITGWKFDDNSNAFANAVTLNGVTSIAAGQSVIFIETASPATVTSFVNTWFGGTLPSNVQIGTYSGSGVGLSTGGDAVNLYNAAGVLQANVAFTASTPPPALATFSNAAGLNNATISTLSKIGSNGAFNAPNPLAGSTEIGSPGTVGRLIVSEVAPWSSGNSPVAADWFELTNTTVEALNIAGWKVDDNSGAPAAAVALNGVTTIAPGESVIFIESANPAAARTAFIANWFGGNAPANLQIGTYTGSGVGLGTGGDAVNIYDDTNVLRASVAFGSSPAAAPYGTFDNAAGRNGIGVTLTQLSVAGTSNAHVAANSANEIGSPGGIVAANDAPTGVNNSVTGLVEDGNSTASGNVLTNDTDPDLVQTTTEVLSVTGARAGTEAGGGALTAVAGATVINGTYGQLTINPNGSFSYALDNARAATNALATGQTVVESFTYQLKDAAGLADTAQIDLSIAGANDGYRLQILHLSDGEAGTLAPQTAPNLAALVDRFEDQFANSITLAGGDTFLPGPFLAAGTDPSIVSILNAVAGFSVAGATGAAPGVVDTVIHNLIGVEASGVGNHEWDLGSAVYAATLGRTTGNPAVFSSPIANYVSVTANLVFSGDSAIRPYFVNTTSTAGLEEASTLKGRLVPSAVLTEGGEKIGLVGVTTQILEAISSPSGTEVLGFPTGPGSNGETNDMALLAAQLQPVINDLIAQGVNKIVLLSHLQQITFEQQLAPLLTGVDIILSAGSNTRLGDATDVAVAFPGHADDFAGPYPIVTAGADGKTTVIVNTDNEYTYLGRLVVDFDNNGDIVLSSIADNVGINGAYASTAANVAAAWGVSEADLGTTAFAAGTRGGNVKTLTDAVNSVIVAKDGNIYGYSDVYLEGERIQVRNQETNLGNVSADANADVARDALGLTAFNAVVSIKNGGGIRAQIGTIVNNPDGTVTKVPPTVGGEVSQLDVENALRFDNKLMVFDTTPQGLLNILNSPTALAPNNGGFIQIGGVSFSYDPTRTVGSRVQDVVLINDFGQITAVIADNGAVVAGAPALITAVVLNFTANGGDQYPIKANGDNFRFLLNDGTVSAPISEALDFTAPANVPANAIGEQQAFKEYFEERYATPGTAYNTADTSQAQDLRIQNQAARGDTVQQADYFLNGTNADNNIVGNDDANLLQGFGGNDTLNGGAGADQLDGGEGSDTASYRDAAAAVTVKLTLTGPQATGGAGSDTLTSIENLTGSAFNDTLTGNDAANVIEGGGGNDILDGGLGIDTASYIGAGSGVTVNLGLLTAQNTGGAGLDTIRNFENLLGSAFEDVLTGDWQANVIDGGKGDDSLDGGNGNDILDGGDGADLLIGGRGSDVLRGGAGIDTASYIGGPGATVDLMLAGPQDTGLGQFDTLIDIENLVGSSVNDTLAGNAGDNRLDGSAGKDTVSYARSLAAVTVSLGLQGAGQNTLGAGHDTLLNFENLTGSAFDDMLAGDGDRNVLDGGAGIDTLTYAAASAGVSISLATAAAQNTGGAGIDTISNFENLVGSAFNDTLGGDAGGNVIDGGTGIDTISYAHATSGVTVSLALQGAAQATGGAGNDTLTNFENLTGSAFDDVLAGNAGDNAIDGGLGVDTLSYAGASAGVTVNLALTTAQDTGGAGIDTIKGIEKLVGTSFNDQLTGSWRSDTLVGGAGADRQTGGGGADLFQFVSVSDFGTGGSRDLITDFSRTQGDRIDLSGIDTNGVLEGDQAFLFVGTSAFSGVACELRYALNAGVFSVSGDLDGDQIADFSFDVAGHALPTLQAADFVL